MVVWQQDTRVGHERDDNFNIMFGCVWYKDRKKSCSSTLFYITVFLLFGTNIFIKVGLIQVKEEGWTGFSEEQPCQPEENPIHPDSFTWIYILFKKGHWVIFLNFSKLYVWRSIIVAKFLEYVYRIIRIFLVLLCHCYVPKIQFYLRIFSLVKKTSTFVALIVSCNWIDYMLV